jgi:hypothetical protein
MRWHVGMLYFCDVRTASAPASAHPSTSMFERLLTKHREHGQSSGHMRDHQPRHSCFW